MKDIELEATGLTVGSLVQALTAPYNKSVGPGWIWLWVKYQPPGDRRFWSMPPLKYQDYVFGTNFRLIAICRTVLFLLGRGCPILHFLCSLDFGHFLGRPTLVVNKQLGVVVTKLLGK